MEKLRNTLLNDPVRNRQSTLYRAQRLAEFTLYDGDPDIVNTELERYLAVTTDEIKSTEERSEEHTSELQSRSDLVCRLLLEKKKKQKKTNTHVLETIERHQK